MKNVCISALTTTFIVKMKITNTNQDSGRKQVTLRDWKNNEKKAHRPES